MTKQTEAMKLAREALEYIDLTDNDRDFLQPHECYMVDEAITALREALAEQPAQQEPVRPCTHPSLGACSLREDGTASRWNCVMCGTEFVPKATQRWAEFNETTKRNIEHAKWYLSTHPQPAQQEPVAWVCEASSSDEKHAIDYWPGDVDELPIGTKLYTSPPAQRKPLSNEEIGQAARDAHITFCLNKHQTYEHALTRAIEAAHGIKGDA